MIVEPGPWLLCLSAVRRYGCYFMQGREKKKKTWAPRGAERLQWQGLLPLESRSCKIPVAESHTEHFIRSVWAQVGRTLEYYWLTHPAVCVCLCNSVRELFPGVHWIIFCEFVLMCERDAGRVNQCVCCTGVKWYWQIIFIGYFFPCECHVGDDQLATAENTK